MQQALVVSQCVESTTTLVESVVELVSEEPPQETKKEATAIFATEKNQGALEGILGKACAFVLLLHFLFKHISDYG